MFVCVSNLSFYLLYPFIEIQNGITRIFCTCSNCVNNKFSFWMLCAPTDIVCTIVVAHLVALNIIPFILLLKRTFGYDGNSTFIYLTCASMNMLYRRILYKDCSTMMAFTSRALGDDWFNLIIQFQGIVTSMNSIWYATVNLGI